MAFRVSTSLYAEYQQIKNTARGLRSFCLEKMNKMAAQSVTRREVNEDLGGALVRAIEVFATASDDMVATAKEQEQDPLYDVQAEFTAMRTACIAARNEIINTSPTQAGTLLERDINADGTLTDLTFAPAQTANLRTLLQGVIDTIEPPV